MHGKPHLPRTWWSTPHKGNTVAAIRKGNRNLRGCIYPASTERKSKGAAPAANQAQSQADSQNTITNTSTAALSPHGCTCKASRLKHAPTTPDKRYDTERGVTQVHASTREYTPANPTFLTPWKVPQPGQYFPVYSPDGPPVALPDIEGKRNPCEHLTANRWKDDRWERAQRNRHRKRPNAAVPKRTCSSLFSRAETKSIDDSERNSVSKTYTGKNPQRLITVMTRKSVIFVDFCN